MRPARLLLTAAASALLLIHALHWRTSWVDDAFITFRYARHFLAGEGLYFNAGDRLEGITNLGWALLLSPFSESDPLLASQVLGCLCGVATVGLLADWARHEALGLPATSALLAGIALAPWPAYWLVQGLETPAVMLMCTLAWSRYRRDVAQGGWSSASGLALGPWFRPDQALLSVILGVWHVWSRGIPRGPLWRSVGVVVLSAILLVSLKLAWYGELLPNTFHVKVDHFPPDRGGLYVRHFLTVPSPWLPALLVGSWMWGLGWAVRKDDRGLPAVISVVWVGAVVLQNGDFFANYRLLVPVWPAAGAALALAVEAAGDVARKSRRAAGLGVAGREAIGWAAAAPALAALVAISGVGAIDNLDSPRPNLSEARKDAPLLLPWRGSGWHGGPKDQMPFPAAWALVNVGPGATVAYSELGVIGFLQDGPVLDMLGLTDRVMARRGGEGWKEQVAYVESRASALIIGTNAGLWPRWRDTLARDPWAPVAACEGTWVFRNKGLPPEPPSSEELQRRLAHVLERTPRAAGIHLAIARELGAAGAPVATIESWLARIEPHVDAGDLARARCDLGVGPGCRAHPSCNRGSPRSEAAALADTARWPGGSPGAAAADAAGAVGGSREAGPGGAALAGTPLADAEASAPDSPAPGCVEVRAATAVAWEALARAWPRRTEFDRVRRASRDAARAARSGEDPIAALAAVRAELPTGASADLLHTLDDITAGVQALEDRCR